MPTEIVMPKLGLNMTEGLLVEWKKRAGDAVRSGDVLFVVETDKVTQEAEATADGVLAQILVEAGQSVPVRTVVGILTAEGERWESAPAPAPATPEPGPAAAPAAVSAAPRPAGGEILASPIARRMAKEHGIDLAQVAGSGAGGRITQEDVERAMAARQAVPAPAPAAPLALSGARAVIAGRMLASAQQTAPVTLTSEVDATELVELRSLHNQSGGGRISYDAILVKLAAFALGEFPYMNARLEEGKLVQPEGIHVGVALDAPRGLLVPVVRDVATRSVKDIAAVLQDMNQRALEGKLGPDELEGGTFTLTNLGMFGVDAFTPIIKLPEAAILGVGRIVDRPAEYHGAVSLRKRMALSLTFDHRLVDGAPAARFLQRLASLIEHPGLVLLGS
ncbi:MAG: dihydrolipoamide acetyltransferase family protein [Anaerolineaceae bacterium]|nr:dihydrolipoamide acetyltransferase family protein [Anaerolineaceae bacterium]